MSFDLQVKMFTEQLAELIEQAKDEASLEFQTERSNYEQEIRVLEGDVLEWTAKAAEYAEKLDAAETRYSALREKLAGLV